MASRPSSFIVTIKRDEASAPEAYYIEAHSIADARRRAAKIGQVLPYQVIDIRPAYAEVA